MKLKNQTFAWSLLLIGSLLSYWTIRHSLGAVFIVQGPSMEPTLTGHELIVAWPTREGKALGRGQVVIIDDGGKDAYAVKRIIGLPGEEVRFRNGSVFIDGNRLTEPYLPAGTFTGEMDSVHREMRLRADEYVVLGDNRGVSLDSRSYGPLRRNRIKAVVATAWVRSLPGLVAPAIP